MQSNTFTTIILNPENGYYLTQSSNDIELKDRIVCSQIALGKNDSIDNWKEITVAEGEQIKAQQEALRPEENN